jgi:hypothetical protein
MSGRRQWTPVSEQGSPTTDSQPAFDLQHRYLHHHRVSQGNPSSGLPSGQGQGTGRRAYRTMLTLSPHSKTVVRDLSYSPILRSVHTQLHTPKEEITKIN